MEFPCSNDITMKLSWCSHNVHMMFPQCSLDVPTLFTWCSHDLFANKLTWHSHVVLLFPFHSIFISFRIIIFWTRDVGTCNGMWLQLPIMPGALPSCHMGLTQGLVYPALWASTCKFYYGILAFYGGLEGHCLPKLYIMCCFISRSFPYYSL
jgi:hypothetical protein